MKKLLILSLVIGAAGITGAALEWTASTDTVRQGETFTLTLNITGDDEGTGIAIGLLTDNGADGTILGVANTPAVWTSGDLGMSMADLEVLFGADLGDDGDWAVIDIIGTGEDARVSGPILDVTYQAGYTLGWVVIEATNLFDLATLHEVYGVGAIPDVVFEVIPIPEPLTLALFGFGGVFLRRRK